MLKIFDTKIEIEMRLFLILGWTSLIANSVGFLSNLIFYGLAKDTIFYGICACCMLMIGIMGEKTGKDKIATGIILTIINIVEFPVMYYLYGMGRIVYMILGVIGILVFCNKGRRIILAALAFVFDVGVMILSVVFPSNYLTLTPQDDIGASVMSFVIVMISMSLIIILIIKQYEVQNKELLHLTEELQNMAIKDPLTLLYNRRYLTQYLEKGMKTEEIAYAIALLDLDDFKRVNDTYGHTYGDEVLQNFAGILKKNIEQMGIAARFGGEEFMLVFHPMTEAQMTKILTDIKREFEEFSMKTRKIRLTYSGGVEILQKPDHVMRLFNAADEKLYLAKKQGKDAVVYEC